MINETDTKKGNSMDLNRQLIEAMADLNEDLVIATVRQMAAEGHSFEEIQQCLNTGISAVGTRFERGDYFIADLIVSGMIYRMKQNAAGLANICILSTMVLVMVFSTLSLWLGMEDTLNSRIRADIDVRSKTTDIAGLEAAVDEVLQQTDASRENTWTYRYLSFSALPAKDGFVSPASFTESDMLIASPATFQVLVLEDYNRMLGLSETLAPGEALLACS